MLCLILKLYVIDQLIQIFKTDEEMMGTKCKQMFKKTLNKRKFYVLMHFINLNMS